MEIIIKGLVVAGSIGMGMELDNIWRGQQIARQIEKFLLKEYSIICEHTEVRK